MIRVRGRIGDLPVDLEIELDAEDWQRLRATPPAPAQAAAEAAQRGGEDRLWEAARELLRQAGTLSGPRLLAELAGLAGGSQAGKRLLVRLRHCPQAQVESRDGVVHYRWIG